MKKSCSKRPKEKELVFVSKAKTQIKGSVEKLNRVLDVIRKQPVLQASDFLFHSNYACGKDLAKLLKSASSNAISKNQILEEELENTFVYKIWATKSIRLKRMKAGPKGRGRPILKSYSHVFIELGVLSSRSSARKSESLAKSAENKKELEILEAEKKEENR